MICYGTNPIAWSNDDDQSLGRSLNTRLCPGASFVFDPGPGREESGKDRQ